MSLKIITLNVQGFKNVRKQQDVMHWARTQRCDILLLQETNFSCCKDVKGFEEATAVKSFFSFGMRRSEGVGIVVLNSHILKDCSFQCDTEGRVICIDFLFKGQKLKIVNVYGPASRGKINSFFANLGTFLLDKDPVIVAGDFNCVVDVNADCRGATNSRAQYHSRELRRLIRDFDLRDVWQIAHPSDPGFTWSRGSAASRLDRVYVSALLEAQVKTCQIGTFSSATGYVSDHSPVEVILSGFRGSPGRPALWRLDVSLLKEQSFVEQMAVIVENSVTPDPEKWDSCKQQWKETLAQMGKDKKRREMATLIKIRHRIKIVKRGGAATPLMRGYLEVLENQYREIMKRSSDIWTQSQKKGSFAGGTEFNKYMHKVRFQGTGRPRITKAKRPDGSYTDDKSEIQSTFVDFFENLFKSERRGRDWLQTEATSPFRDLPQVPEDVAKRLIEPVSAAEVLMVIQSMKNGKAPGSDGLPVEFYRAFWRQLGKPLVLLLNKVLELGVAPRSFGLGRVVLLPKEDADSADPKSWRPITLLNVDFKILTTVLGRRLRDALPHIVSPQQTSCVPGRSVFMSLTLVKDLLAYVNSRKMSGVVLSLDQMKAFDRVEHDYLFFVLKCFGLPDTFVSWLKTLYAGQTSELVLNGEVSRRFSLMRGVRQGCPLSPVLFILSLEPFLRSVQQCPNVIGFPTPGSGTVKVSAYADDVVIFVRDGRSLSRVFDLFASYGELSGAKLNLQKSKALYVGSFSEPPPVDISRTDKVRVLGVTFLAEGVSRGNWVALERNIRDEIETAAQYRLSYQERAYLIKTISYAKIWYLARVSLPPARFVLQVNRVFNNFLWAEKSTSYPSLSCDGHEIRAAGAYHASLHHAGCWR